MSERGPLLALKVDVDTLRGTREGVPRLAQLLRRHQAQATFLFSVGPDHTGRALRRVFRPGFLSKVKRTSVVEHYGLRTLLYGTLLPGPHIGRSCAREMKAVRSDGFEVGLHSYDHVKWQDFVSARDERWTSREMELGIEAFGEVFGERPKVHGAAGWQMNDSAFELEKDARFDYCSDTRGTDPFVPVLANGATAPPQVPTTLPTLDELIGLAGMSADDAASHLLGLTQKPAGAHVFTLHAELEGMRLLSVFTKLLEGWAAQGYELVDMRHVLNAASATTLRMHQVAASRVPGRSGTLMIQGKQAEPRRVAPAMSDEQSV
jgi:undecaprenyl phosphate-alpha-L-ara4FN deformylase